MTGLLLTTLILPLAVALLLLVGRRTFSRGGARSFALLGSLATLGVRRPSNTTMDLVRQDLRHALRGLLRTPGFTLVSVLTLALGIGANTAIFSIVNGVALRPLGYPKPEQLMFLTSQFPAQGFLQFWVSPPEFFEFKEINQS